MEGVRFRKKIYGKFYDPHDGIELLICPGCKKKFMTDIPKRKWECPDCDFTYSRNTFFTRITNLKFKSCQIKYH